MRRREFIALLGGAAAKGPIIGLASIGASPTDPANFRPFLADCVAKVTAERL
jgi:hypothetical protein